MAEIVEADTFDAGLLGGAFEAAVGDVPVLERGSFARGEDRSLVLRVSACEAEVDQVAAKVVGKGDAPDAGGRFRRPVLAADQPLPADVQDAGVLVEVAPLEAEHLAEAETEPGGEAQQRRVVGVRGWLLREPL
jgi:hypothetical protein